MTRWLGSATEGEKLVGFVYTCSLVLNLVPKLIYLVLVRLVFTISFLSQNYNKRHNDMATDGMDRFNVVYFAAELNVQNNACPGLNVFAGCTYIYIYI